MLKTMRANAGSWIIKFLLLAIVIVFVFWGVGSYNSQRDARLAVVNGETISWEDFNKSYITMIDSLKRQYGDRLDDNMIQMLNIKGQVLTDMINSKLLVEEAHRMDLDVSNEELADAIRSISAFHTNGKFDNQRYRMMLNSRRMSPEEFELKQKEAMLINKLRTMIYSTVKVSDAEAMEWFEHNQSTVSIDYVLFSPNAYADIAPADEDVQAYFDENKTAYRTQPMLKAQYFRFSPDDYTSKVTIGKDVIENYYNENMESFLEPKTVEARHILIKLPQDPSPEIIAEKRTQAEEIMKMAKEGKDFAELAKTYSEGPSKSNGGYLGSFRKEQMVAPFSDTAFAMKAGDISEPVQTQFGWHIIKVEKVNEEKQKSLAEATPDIEKKLAEKEAEYMAYNDAETVYDATYDDDSLKNIAQTMGFKLWTTAFFTKSGGPSNVSQPVKFADVAFSMETDDISNIETIGSDLYIIQVIESRPAEIPALEAVKATVKKDLIKKIQDDTARKDAETFLANLSEPAADRENPAEKKEFVSTGFFKRNDSIPTIGYEKSISDAAFLLSSENPLPENVIQGSKAYYVIRFKERKKPEKASFALEKKDIKANLTRKKQMETFNSLVESLREKGDISIAKEFTNA